MVKRLPLILLLLLLSARLFSQIDNTFWFVAPNISASHGDNPVYMRLSSMSEPVNFVLTMPADHTFVPITGSIGPNSTYTIDLTPFKSQIENDPSDQINTKGLLLTTDNLVTAYYEDAHTNNPGIFALKGRNALGLEFYIISQNSYPNQVADSQESFEIVATEDNTTVTITPTDEILNGHLPGVTFTIYLNKGETYSARSVHQAAIYTLAGSHITANKPIAITWCDDSILTGGYDVVGDQIIPVSIIGQEYIAIRGFANNTAGDNEERVFIVAVTDNTGITIDGTFVQFLNSGALLNYPIPPGNNTAYIQTSYPAYVMHLSGYPGESGASLLPQIYCTGSNQIGFYRTSGGSFALMILTQTGNVNDFLMDGSSTVIQASDFTAVPGTGGTWMYCRKPMSTGELDVGSHLLTNATGKFHLGIINMLGGSSEYGYFSYFSTLNLGPDRSICPGSSTLLDGGEDWTTYLWEQEIAGTWVPITGGTTQTITVTDPGRYRCSVTGQNCALQDDIMITHYPTINPDITGEADLCEGASGIVYTASTGFSPYTWSVPGGNITAGQGTNAITVDWTTTGNQTITLDCQNINGCAASQAYPVSVNPNPLVAFTQPDPTCLNIPPFELNGATPLGGVFSGTGVTAGFFDPAIGVGTYPITYDYTDANGCSGSDVKSITVNDIPVVGFDQPAPVCQSASPYALTGGSPAGGVYSGPGVNSTTGYFDPAIGAGTHMLTYTYNEINGCTDTDSKEITVYPSPVVTLDGQLPVCISAAPYVLTGGLPAGGIYSGPGVNSTTGFFDPAIGAGDHAITYTYTNSDGCFDDEVKTLTVHPLPVIAFAPLTPACINATPFLLTAGTPAGGEYSGTGVNTATSTFTPALAPYGSLITYAYTDGNGCSNSAQQSQAVIPLPTTQGTLTGSSEACQHATGTPYILLNPDPLATSFIWSLTPTTAGTVTGTAPSCAITWSDDFTGTALLIYEEVSSCGSSGPSGGFPITIKPEPVVTLTACNDLKTTKNGKPIVLKGGLPLGVTGIYEGTGIYESPSGSGSFVFDPSDPLVYGSAAGIPYTITFRYTNTEGCDATATEEILVYPSNASQPCQTTRLTDIRDGATYETFVVGSGASAKCWMSENLNFGTFRSGSVVQTDNCINEKYCAGDVASGCNDYGGYYQWDEMMLYGAAEGEQGICPPGWHVATLAEWDQLLNEYLGVGQAGGTLKETATPTGFHGFTTGINYLNQSWSFTSGIVTGSMFWTSRSLTPSTARANGLNNYNPSVSSYNASRANGFQVRCVKDN